MTTRWNKDGVRHVGGFTLEVFEGFNPHNRRPSSEWRRRTRGAVPVEEGKE